MTYIVKCLSGIHSKDDFIIKAGQELETSKEIYEYFNSAFGSSGKFTFETKNKPKAVKAKVVVKEEEAPKPKAKAKPKTTEDIEK